MLREPNADVELIDWPSVSYQHRLRDERVAIAVLDMLVNSQKWMHRRLETVTFVTDTTIRRHIGLDISIPPAAPDVEGPAARRRLVPLTMVRKHRLVHVDLRTGDGRPLPYLNLRQNQALAESMLLTWAREVLGGAHLGRDIEADLRAVVSGRGPDLLDAMRLFATQSGPLGRKRAALWRAPEFRLLFHQLANDFILLALVDEEPTRQIVELEYEDSLHLDGLVSVFRRAHHRNVSPGARTRLAWRVTRSTIGWRPSDVRFTLPAAGDAETFHLQVEAPPGTYARDAVLLARDPTGSRPPPDGDDARNQWDREGGRTRVDLRVADVRPGDVVDARVSLAAVRRGWLSHAALAAVASTVVLGIGLAAR